jgi:hypothetical protein
LDEYWATEQPKVDVLRSTGLYAKAGTIVEIAVAKDFITKIQVISTVLSKLSLFYKVLSIKTLNKRIS